MRIIEHNRGCAPDFRYKFKKRDNKFFTIGAASYIKQIEEDCFDKEGNCVGKYRTGAKYMRDFWGVSDYLDNKMHTWDWEFQVNYELYSVSINSCASGLFSGGWGVVGKRIIKEILDEFFPDTVNPNSWQPPNNFVSKDLLLVELVYSYFPGHGVYRYVDLRNLSLNKIIKYCEYENDFDEWWPNHHHLLDYFGKDFPNNIDKIASRLITKINNYGN